MYIIAMNLKEDFWLQSILTTVNDTLKALVFAALTFADRGQNLKAFHGTYFCGCLILKNFATLIFAEEIKWRNIQSSWHTIHEKGSCTDWQMFDNNSFLRVAVLTLSSTDIFRQCRLFYRQSHVAGHSLILTFEKKNYLFLNFCW